MTEVSTPPLLIKSYQLIFPYNEKSDNNLNEILKKELDKINPIINYKYYNKIISYDN